MTTPTSLRKRADELGLRRGVASDLAHLQRQVDILDRRERIRATDGLRLAQSIIDLDAIKRRLPKVEALAAKGDVAAKIAVGEVPHMEQQVNEKLRQYLVEVPEVDISRLGLLGWAKKMIRTDAARKRAAEERRRARAAAQSKRAARPGDRPAKPNRTRTSGTCARCGKRGQLNEKRLCGVCQVEAATGNLSPVPSKGRTRRIKVADPGPRGDRAAYHLADLFNR